MTAGGCARERGLSCALALAAVDQQNLEIMLI
jgi:hypothetical protein